MSNTETTEATLPKGAPKASTTSNEVEKMEPTPIDPVLVEKLAVLRALVNIDNLLQNCLFPGGGASDVIAAKQFLQKLHAPIMKECQSHPDFARTTVPATSQVTPPPPTPTDTQTLDKAN